MPDRVATGGGRYDPTEEAIYFIAASPADTTLQHPYVLMAMDQFADKMEGSEAYQRFCATLAAGARMMLDSGIFWLTNRHARAHGVSMDEALALAPHEIDGFAELLPRYVDVCKLHEDDLWGYVELDQGGADNKKATRSRLEQLGLHPMPVYHPLVDGWDYFDELCEGYDRVCYGNIVQADAPTRRRLLMTMWERKRRYPDTWIHLLGLTPNELTLAWPSNSADSSSWMLPLRWGAEASRAHAMTVSFGRFDHEWSYDRKVDTDAPGGWSHGLAHLAGEAAFQQATWRQVQRDLAALGVERWPLVADGEELRAP